MSAPSPLSISLSVAMKHLQKHSDPSGQDVFPVLPRDAQPHPTKNVSGHACVPNPLLILECFQPPLFNPGAKFNCSPFQSWTVAHNLLRVSNSFGKCPSAKASGTQTHQEQIRKSKHKQRQTRQTKEEENLRNRSDDSAASLCVDDDPATHRAPGAVCMGYKD